MAVVVASTSALSVAANAKSADQVSGQYQYVGRGKFTLVARASATGLNTTCQVGGVAVVNDQVIPYTGTAGGISTQDNVVASQVMPGGRVELTFRNTTGAAITVDSVLYFEPL